MVNAGLKCGNIVLCSCGEATKGTSTFEKKRVEKEREWRREGGRERERKKSRSERADLQNIHAIRHLGRVLHDALR